MYAAAGGASLASRQARQRQRQNKKLQQQQQLKTQQQHNQQQKQQNKLYHNYTDDAISKLSRVERGTLLRLPQTHHQQHERRHSASNYNLKDPICSGSSGVGGGVATLATSRLKGSPSISIPVQPTHHHHHHSRLLENHIVAGAATTTTASTSSLQLPQILLPLPVVDGENKLERRCSFVRQVEEEMVKSHNNNHEQVGLLDRCHHLSNFEIKETFYNTNTEIICKDMYGSLEYPFSECSQGRAAWQERERERRCSLTDDPHQHRLKHSEAHHRWMKRNRIHDLSYGGESEDYDFFSIYYQSAAANALLYVGLGTIAIGSVIFFVGTGEKGFKTVELRLIGPTMVACGVLCCLIRVLLCACPASTCFQRHQQQDRRKKKKRTRLEEDACTHLSNNKYPNSSKNRQHIEFHTDNSTSLLLDRQTNNNNNNKKRVSIIPPQPTDNNDNKDNNNINNDNTAISNIMFIPKINLPKNNNSNSNCSNNNNNDNNDNKQSSTIQICDDDDDDDDDDIINIELDNIDNTNDIQSVSSNESICNDNTLINITEDGDNDADNNGQRYLKVIIENNSADDSNIACSDNTTTTTTTTTSNNNERNCVGASCTNLDNDKIVTHSGIVLSPLQLQQ